ncbi:hypothetical protein CXB51_015084 [Gossypium anomalum]|uniref:Aspartic peptidase DDI1-type domain-containing protein n=1 Tax=Gossypium anomalum TaxID=47600 RepID=A0A8J6D334_9ROSI|nr:hypothetical protein CXB51_015084 [Gossypium anomalum]
MVDAAAGGTINNKTPEEAYEFIEEMSLNNYQWQVMRTKPTKAANVFNIDSVTMLSNQVELLNKKIDGFLGSSQVHPVMQCEASGGSSSEYPPYGHHMENEQLNYMGNNPQSQNNPYSKTYNTGSLPSNIKANPREQLNAITSQDEERPKQETMISKGKGEQKPMPKAFKFLKELIVNKGKLDEASHVKLNAVCSAILQNKLPDKLKDQGSFMIPCLIGSLDVHNALADLGVSINVMPYKMFRQLGLGKPKQTRMSIQLADKTIRFPRGIIEDVLVKIDKFIYLVGFVVLDMEEDNNVPLILGRPFLATSRTIIDVGTGELTLRVGEEAITLQARNVINTLNSKGAINHTTNTNHVVQPSSQEPRSKSLHEPSSNNNKGSTHEERRLQIEELDGWWTHKPRKHNK